jgi:hypothetical protein
MLYRQSVRGGWTSMIERVGSDFAAVLKDLTQT